MTVQLQKALGLTNHSKVFKEAWKRHNIPTLQKDYGEITVNRQGAFSDPEVRENFDGFAARHLNETLERSRSGQMATKQTDEAAISDITPLVYDTDFLEILADEAPIVSRVPEEGQDGFEAHYIRIDERDDAIGFEAESNILDLTGSDRSGMGTTRGSDDMKIWVDLVEISDFAAAGSEFFFDVRDTLLGERFANHAQEKEQATLYADPGQAGDQGNPADANAYTGFGPRLEAANMDEDKSATDISGTEGLVRDIKSEIKELVQSVKAVNKSDLELWTSHTLFDHLENEIEPKRRVSNNDSSTNYGLESITVSGVDVFPSHNVTAHSFDVGDGTTYDVGSEGDVFIMNRREMRYRSLMPLSTVPLARLGFGELVAMGEFTTPILRGDGNLCKYLKNYNI